MSNEQEGSPGCQAVALVVGLILLWVLIPAVWPQAGEIVGYLVPVVIILLLFYMSFSRFLVTPPPIEPERAPTIRADPELAAPKPIVLLERDEPIEATGRPSKPTEGTPERTRLLEAPNTNERTPAASSEPNQDQAQEKGTQHILESPPAVPAPPKIPAEMAQLLKESIPNRFINLSPRQFEEFIGQLFRDAGYQVSLTKQTGDFGADLLIKKGAIEDPGPRIAVQVKRYQRDRSVGVKDINQAIGAKSFYGCDRVMVITTSDFSRPGVELAEKTQVELWDWDRLYQQIKEIYCEGQDIYEFFKGSSGEPSAIRQSTSERLSFRIEQIWDNQQMQDNTTATIIHVKLRNNSGERVELQLAAMPTCIDTLGNQFDAYVMLNGSFVQGIIYPHASVTISYCWYSWQLPKAATIDRMILRYHEGASPELQEVIFDKTGQVYVSQTPGSAPAKSISAQAEQPPEMAVKIESTSSGYSIRGRGQQASPTFTLSAGLAIFHISHDGSQSFYIGLLDSNGVNKETVVMPMSGRFNGSTAVGIHTPGVYLLNVKADGNWVVTIEQPGEETIPNP